MTVRGAQEHGWHLFEGWGDDRVHLTDECPGCVIDRERERADKAEEALRQIRRESLERGPKLGRRIYDIANDVLAARPAPALARHVEVLTEALRRIEHLPYSVMGDAESDLQRVKEIANAALAARPSQGTPDCAATSKWDDGKRVSTSRCSLPVGHPGPHRTTEGYEFPSQATPERSEPLREDQKAKHP